MKLYDIVRVVLGLVSNKIIQEKTAQEKTAQERPRWGVVTPQELTTQVPDYQALLDRIEVLMKNLVIRLPDFLKILELLGEVIKKIQISGIVEVFDYYAVDTLFGIILGIKIREIFNEAKIYINGSRYSMKIPLALLIAKIVELLEVINSLQTRCQVNEFIQELMWKLSLDGKIGCLRLTDIRCKIFRFPATYFLTLSDEEDEEFVNNKKLHHLEYTIYWVALLFVLHALLEKEKYLEKENEKEEKVEELADYDAEYDQFEPNKNSKKSRRGHPNKSR